LRHHRRRRQPPGHGERHGLWSSEERLRRAVPLRRRPHHDQPDAAMTMRTRHVILIAVAATLCLFGTACGGGAPASQLSAATSTARVTVTPTTTSSTIASTTTSTTQPKPTTTTAVPPEPRCAEGRSEATAAPANWQAHWQTEPAPNDPATVRI